MKIFFDTCNRCSRKTLGEDLTCSACQDCDWPQLCEDCCSDYHYAEEHAHDAFWEKYPGTQTEEELKAEIDKRYDQYEAFKKQQEEAQDLLRKKESDKFWLEFDIEELKREKEEIEEKIKIINEAQKKV
jgi:hypothetical protein